MASVFDIEEFKPYQEPLNARASEAQKFLDWYTGKVYDTKNVSFAGEFNAQVKALFHPLARATDLHASFLPGFPAYDFTRDVSNENGQVERLGTAPEDVNRARKILKWSRWGELGATNNMNYVLKGKAIMVLVSRAEYDEVRPVALDVYDPANTMLVFKDKWSDFPDMLIHVTQKQPRGAEEAKEYAVIITAESTDIYFDGAPYNEPPYEDGTPGLPASTPNAFGFVPAVEATFRDIGNGSVQNVFSTVVPMITTVNRLATYVMGVMSQYFQPQLYVSGAERGDEDIEWGQGMLFGPVDSKPVMLTADLDLNGATAFVKTIHDEIKANLPELIFDSIRGINRISTEGLELQFAELISKLTVSRAGMDRALNAIIKVAIWAASKFGAEGFENVPEYGTPEYEEWVVELDPLRGYVPLGESAILGIEKQRIDVELSKKNLQHADERFAMEQQASVAKVNSSASNDPAKPNPKSSGPDATSPGPHQKANDGQPQER